MRDTTEYRISVQENNIILKTEYSNTSSKFGRLRLDKFEENCSIIENAKNLLGK